MKEIVQRYTFKNADENTYKNYPGWATNSTKIFVCQETDAVIIENPWQRKNGYAIFSKVNSDYENRIELFKVEDIIKDIDHIEIDNSYFIPALCAQFYNFPLKKGQVLHELLDQSTKKNMVQIFSEFYKQREQDNVKNTNE